MKKLLALIIAAALGAGVFGVELKDVMAAAQNLGQQLPNIGGLIQNRNAYSGKVTAVADGDTVRLTDSNGRNHKIRLAYIDAPEKQQAHGLAARQALSDWVLHETVNVTVFDTDQYQREVAKITLNSEDINLKLLQNGHVWHYRSIAAKAQDKAEFAIYENAEKQAKSQRLGLWQQRNPQEPWAFRKQNRNNQ